jgi:transmembrane protein TMEM43
MSMRGSIGGFFIGLLFVPGAFIALIWNEGRAVETARSLEEGAKTVISVPADAVAPANDNKLVYVSGQTVAIGAITDPDFGISAEHALRLERAVEMYQWKESSSTSNGNTSFSYSKTWSSHAIDSSNFHVPGHDNPEKMPIEPESFNAKGSTLGAFNLSDAVIEKLGTETFTPDPKKLGRNSVATKKHFKLTEEGVFYHGDDPAAPAIGDVRVSFKDVPAGVISVVAQQTGDTLGPYLAKAGGTVLLVNSGVVPAAAMFHEAQQANTILTWIIRGAGFFFMFIGFAGILGPVEMITDWIPFLGHLIRAGVGFIAFLAALFFSFLTIAITWVVVRPLLGISLLVGAAAILFWLIRLHAKHKALAQQQSQAAKA